MKKLTEKEILEQLEKEYGRDLFYFNIINLNGIRNSIIKCTCKKCGHVKEKKFLCLRKGDFYCRKCSHNKKLITEKEILFFLEKKYSNFIFEIKKYDNKKTNKSLIQCTCKNCGEIFNRSFMTLKYKTIQCPNCEYKSHNVHSFNKIKKEIEEKGYEFIEGIYLNNRSPLTIKCKECGTTFKTTYFQIQHSKKGCTTCQYNSLRKNSDVYERKILELYNGTIIPITKYIGCKKKIKVKCNVCENIWETRADYLLEGSGCPHCSKGKSYPNKLMKQILLLKSNELDYIKEELSLHEIDKTWKGRHRFDFAIKKEDKKYIIEMDGGIGHDNKTNDNIKDKLAIENGYEVIRINANYPCVSKRFSFLKENIIKSKLNDIISINNISDEMWNEINKKSIISQYRDIWEYYEKNPNKTYKEIGEIFNKKAKSIYRIIEQFKNKKNE